ncbi:MAG: hypothetical protein C4536_13735 [Actinobacteria bacterium]|jgi:hypothetical protein|nr:MAG: hypothetical protein C4536_13735 [Actinomycetota bacterium]
MSKGWRRLVAITCTLLLAGSVFLILGVTVWAQEQPTEQPVEQPTTTEQPVETEQPVQPTTTEQPAQPAQEPQGLTIDYWEPLVGTRTVYYINDFMNDIFGNIYGTGQLGYWDAAYLYATSLSPDDIFFYYTSPSDINYSSSYYRSVEALSDMNPVYFGLEGPWYFNMTTPFKYIEEVVGIHEAPDAGKFPQATYAVRYLIIGSGGHRAEGFAYRSNDATEKRWLEWGLTMEWFGLGQEKYPKKEIVYYRSPSDTKISEPQIIVSFPLSVGTTGSLDAVYSEGGGINEVSASGTYEVIAEGEITLPAGTFDALMLKANITSPPDGERATQIEYYWFVKDLGVVVDIGSLVNEIGPLFETATEILVLEEQTGSVAGQQ